MSCGCCSPFGSGAAALPRANAFGLGGTVGIAPGSSASGPSTPIFGFAAPGGLGVTVVMQATIIMDAVAGLYELSASIEYSFDNAAWSSAGTAVIRQDFSASAQISLAVVGAFNAGTTIWLRLTVGNEATSVGNIIGPGAAVVATECQLF